MSQTCKDYWLCDKCTKCYNLRDLGDIVIFFCVCVCILFFHNGFSLIYGPQLCLQILPFSYHPNPHFTAFVTSLPDGYFSTTNLIRPKSSFLVLISHSFNNASFPPSIASFIYYLFIQQTRDTLVGAKADTKNNKTHCLLLKGPAGQYYTKRL